METINQYGKKKCFGYFQNEQGDYTIYYGEETHIITFVSKKADPEKTIGNLNEVLEAYINQISHNDKPNKDLDEELNQIWAHATRGFHLLPNNLERRKEAIEMIKEIISDRSKPEVKVIRIKEGALGTVHDECSKCEHTIHNSDKYCGGCGSLINRKS